jgi:hypothetical protein
MRERMAALETLHTETRRLADAGDEAAVRSNYQRARDIAKEMRNFAKPLHNLTFDMMVDRAERKCAEIHGMIALAQRAQAPHTKELPMEGGSFEPPVKPKRTKRASSAAQALSKRSAPFAEFAEESVTHAKRVTGASRAKLSAKYTLTCVVCKSHFESRRKHAKTCCAACRKKLSRVPRLAARHFRKLTFL